MIRWINEYLGTASYQKVKQEKSICILDIRDLVDKSGNSQELILEKINRGVEYLNEGKKVVVCCDYGMSRSNAIAVGILGKWLQIDFEDAVKIVQETTKEKDIKLQVLMEVKRAMGQSEKYNALSKKRILITGGSGFIGKNLIPLLKEDNEVFAPTHKEIDILTDYISLNLYVSQNKISKIIHLANPNIYNSNSAMGSTVLMLKNIIDVCEVNDLELVYLSGWEIYSGYATNHLLAGEKMGMNPKGVYAETKVLCEQLLQIHRLNNDLKCTIIRSSPVYGIGSDKPKFIYNFIEKAKKEEEIYTHIYINDEPKMDLIYIDDLCEVVQRIIRSDLIGEFNVGTGNLVSTTDIANMIVLQLKSASIINQRQIKTHCANIAMDTSKVKSIFKWEHKIDIYEGIKKVLNMNKENGNDK